MRLHSVRLHGGIRNYPAPGLRGEERYYMNITLKQFKNIKNLMNETFPFNIGRNLAKTTIKAIRHIMAGDPRHTLWDSWCGQEKEYFARESECSETSWDDHDSNRCLTCKIIEEIHT